VTLRFCLFAGAVSLAMVAAAPPARADTTIEIASQPPATAEIPFKIGVSKLVGDIRLRNSANAAAGARSYTAGPTLTRVSDGFSVPAHWRRIDRPDDMTIAPGAQMILELSAELTEPGVYETSIDTAYKPAADAAEQPDRRIRVVVTREMESLPADFLVDPKPVRRVYWPYFSQGGEHVQIEMHNVSTKPIAFAPPAVLSVTDKNGDRSHAIAAAREPALNGAGCPNPLPAGARCALDLVLPEALPPGEYALDVGVDGRGGGSSVKSVKFSVRYSFVVAFVVICLGVFGGWYVQFWRASGRRALNGLAALTQLRDRLRRIVGSPPSDALSAVAASIEDELDGLTAKCQAGADAIPDLDAIGQRLGRLAAIAMLETSFAALPLNGRTRLARLRADLIARAGAAVLTDAERNALDARRRALAANINDWPRLDAAEREAAATLPLASQALGLTLEADERTALSNAAAALRDAQTAAADPVAADAAEGATAAKADALTHAREGVTAAIDAAAQGLEGRLRTEATAQAAGQDAPAAERGRAVLAQLARLAGLPDRKSRLAALERIAAMARGDQVNFAGSAPAVEAVPAAAAEAPGLDFPVAALLNLAPGQTIAAITRQARINEYVTNLFVLVAAGLAGVVLIASNETWGAGVDVISALLGGFGARLALGEVGGLTGRT
jgi:hypothetical protein